MVKELKGMIYALLSAIAFGSVPILTMYVYKNNIDTQTLLFLRFSFAFVLLSVYMFYKNRKFLITRDKIIKLFIINGGFYTIFSLCFFTAIKIIPVSLAIIIFFTYPIILAVITIIFKDNKLSKKILILLFMTFIGLALVLGEVFNTDKISGLILAAGAALFYSFYTLYNTSVLKKYLLIETVTLSYFFSALVFLIIFLSEKNFNLDISYRVWLIVLTISVISLIGFLFFLKALKLSKPVNVSILTMCEPIITIILSVLLLKEKLNYLQILGIIIVLLSVYNIIFNKKIAGKTLESSNINGG